MKNQLGLLSKIKSKKCLLPIVDDVLFMNNQMIKLSGDCQIFMVIDSPVKFDSPFTVDFAKLNKIAGKVEIDSFDTSKYQDEKRPLVINSNKGSFKLHGQDVEDYPKLPDMGSPDYSGVLDLSGFKEYCVFAGKNELRPEMMQVYIDSEQICSTDAHRLLFRDVDNSFIPKDKNILLPSLPWLSGEYRCQVKGLWISLSNNEYKLYIKMADERFPDYRNVIPKSNSIIAPVSTKELIEKLELADSFTNQTTHQVKFIFTGNTLELQAEDLDLSTEYSGKIDIECNDTITIGFNARLMLEYLKLDKKREMTKISLSQPNRAGIINGEYLLMPVMLNSYV